MPERSLSEVGTPPPHDLDTPHVLVAGNTLSPNNIRKFLWKVVLCWQALYISNFLFIIVISLLRIFLGIIRHSSIHELEKMLWGFPSLQ